MIEAYLAVANIFIYISHSMGYLAHNSPASRAQRTRRGRVFLRVAKAGTKIWWPQSRALMAMGWGTADIALTSPVKLHFPYWLDSRSSVSINPVKIGFRKWTEERNQQRDALCSCWIWFWIASICGNDTGKEWLF